MLATPGADTGQSPCKPSESGGELSPDLNARRVTAACPLLTVTTS
jgi:hypothetical protein